MIVALPALPARNDFGDTMSDGLAGPMGLFIIVLLVVATILLIRNMNSRLRRLPDQFPQNAATGMPDQDDFGADMASDGLPSGQDDVAEQADHDATTKRSPA